MTLPRPAPGSATWTARVTAGTDRMPRGEEDAGQCWLVDQILLSLSPLMVKKDKHWIKEKG